MLIVMIAGALGSGKTTTLLSLAQTYSENGYRVGILENDAGKIPVDAPALRERGYSVTDMPSGCICCNLSSQLPQSLEGIREKFNPDILFVEPSGIAAPGILKNIFKGQLLGNDCMTCLYIMDLLRFSQNRKLMTSPFFERSLHTADLVLYSKAGKTVPGTADDFLKYTRDISVRSDIIDADSFIKWDISRLNSSVQLQRPESVQNPAITINPPKPDVNKMGEEYQLKWKDSVSPDESKESLFQFVEEIRKNIMGGSSNSIGTIKIFTTQGEGSIISVSDNTSPPGINQKIPWTSCPDRIVLNVLTYGEKNSLPDTVSKSFGQLRSKVVSIQK